MNRNQNHIAEIIGGAGAALGFIMGFIAFVAGGIGSLLHIGGAFGFFISSFLAMFLAILGGIGVALSRIELLVGGVFMATAGALGVYLVGGFYIIPSALLIAAGLIAIIDSFRSWDTITV